MLAIASNSKRAYLPSNTSYKNTTTCDSIWGKDTYHLVAAGGQRACFEPEGRTLCGRKTYGWTTPWEAEEIDWHCCSRCAAKA